MQKSPGLRKIWSGLIVVVFMMGFHNTSRACSPLAVPNLLNQSFSGNFLLLDWESINTWTCPGYSVQVEIACFGSNFTGAGPFYLSPVLNKTATPQAYPQQTVNVSTFCPGKVYQFRAREASGSIFSPWTATYTFVIPGNFVQPSLNVTASNNIICPPQTSQLNVTINDACGGPFTYAWSPATGLSNATIANPVASPTVSTSYSVTVNGGPFGCWTASGSVLINTGLDPPVVGTGSAIPALVCVGKSTTLTLSSFTGNIQWQSGPSGSGPWTNINGAVTNSYVTAPLTGNLCFHAVVTSCTGTVTSNAFCVSANPTPVLVPSVQQISCSNSVAVANMGNPGSSGSPVTVTWTPAPNSLASQSTVASYTNPGVVTVTANFSDGCVSTASMTINPTPPSPTFAIINTTGSSSITCIYPTIDIYASTTYTYGTINYYWSSASFTASTQSVTIVNPGSYSITLTDPATNCSITHTTQIYLNNAVPQSSVTPINQSISCGPGVVATATGIAINPTVNVSHSWYAPGLPAPYTSGGQISIYYPTVGTNTYVLTNLINGCSTTKTIQVISTGGFYPSFSVTSFSSANTFTIGCSTTSLTDINIVGANTNPPPGGGVVSYTLLPPAYTGTNYATSPLVPSYTVNSPGTYTLIVKDNGNQCETRLLLAVVQNTFGPNIYTSVSTQTLSCLIPSVVLQGNSTNPNVTYTWKRTLAPPLITNSVLPVNTTPAGASVPSATVIDNYTLTVVDNNNLCSTTTVVTMYQNTRPPKPGIAFSHTALTCITYSVNATNNSTTGILPGTFFGTGGLNAILWQGPTPQEDKQNSSTYIAFTPGFYTMTVMDMNNGCTSQTTALLGDNRVYPVINVLKTYSLDCGAPSLTITATFVPTTGLLYQWNVEPGASVGTTTQSVLQTNSPGEYQIVATSATNGCSSYSLVEVVNGKLFANIEPDVSSGFAPLSVNFTNNSASSANSASIISIWSFGNGATRTTTTNITTTAVYQQAGTYTVTMFAAKGSCLDTVVKIITVDIPSKLEVPNVFTPNGDNANDIFFVNTANLSEISATIFDRWGNKIYELTTDKGNIAWDGKSNNGKEAPDGTYFYVIKATGKDGQNYDKKGNISLYR